MHEGNYSCSVPDYINTPVRIHIIEGKIGKYLPKCKNIVKLQKCFQDSLVCRTSEDVGWTTLSKLFSGIRIPHHLRNSIIIKENLDKEDQFTYLPKSTKQKH